MMRSLGWSTKKHSLFFVARRAFGEQKSPASFSNSAPGAMTLSAAASGKNAAPK